MRHVAAQEQSLLDCGGKTPYRAQDSSCVGPDDICPKSPTSKPQVTLEDKLLASMMHLNMSQNIIQEKLKNMEENSINELRTTQKQSKNILINWIIVSIIFGVILILSLILEVRFKLITKFCQISKAKCFPSQKDNVGGGEDVKFLGSRKDAKLDDIRKLLTKINENISFQERNKQFKNLKTQIQEQNTLQFEEKLKLIDEQFKNLKTQIQKQNTPQFVEKLNLIDEQFKNLAILIQEQNTPQLGVELNPIDEQLKNLATLIQEQNTSQFKEDLKNILAEQLKNLETHIQAKNNISEIFEHIQNEIIQELGELLIDNQPTLSNQETTHIKADYIKMLEEKFKETKTKIQEINDKVHKMPTDIKHLAPEQGTHQVTINRKNSNSGSRR